MFNHDDTIREQIEKSVFFHIGTRYDIHELRFDPNSYRQIHTLDPIWCRRRVVPVTRWGHDVMRLLNEAGEF